MMRHTKKEKGETLHDEVHKYGCAVVEQNVGEGRRSM